eukprot:m.167620 g.167620  ORF g.167620 m.167620 type:complete len:116 (-) comp14736_c0_seq1:974-1321(-)
MKISMAESGHQLYFEPFEKKISPCSGNSISAVILNSFLFVAAPLCGREVVIGVFSACRHSDKDMSGPSRDEDEFQSIERVSAQWRQRVGSRVERHSKKSAACSSLACSHLEFLAS